MLVFSLVVLLMGLCATPRPDRRAGRYYEGMLISALWIDSGICVLLLLGLIQVR